MSNNDKINAENTNNTPLGNFYNFQDFKEINNKSKSKHVVIATSISVILFGALFFYSGFYNQASDAVFAPKPINDLQEKYHIGQLGNAHTHAALVMFIDDKPVDFAQEQFQLKSKYIHFENNNSYLIHRHATGVTLEMLFDSIGIKLTQDCIILSDERSYCNNDTHTIKLFVNKLEFTDISEYVPNHNDRILVSYSEKSYNNIPEQLSYLESLEIYNIPKNQNTDNYTSV